MAAKLLSMVAVTGLFFPLALSAARPEVILEDEGLYEKELWDIGQYYDDLDDPQMRWA